MSKLVLLDTHAWIWLALGHEKMKKGPAAAAIQEAFDEQALHLSAISLWELSTLESKGRVRLSLPCLDWIEESCHRLRLNVVPISASIAVESGRLPGGFHGDPADRLIVATARKEKMVLVTQDALILDYAQAGLLRALSCY